MLGITITNHPSVGEHVRDVIGKCTQSLYALNAQSTHVRRLFEARLQGGRSLKVTVCFDSLVGLHQRAADKRLEASTRRAVRSGLYVRG